MNLYIAPEGKDSNSGTRRRPFATLERARDEIRRLKRAGKFTEPVSVIFAEGVYPLERPVEFTDEDSGTETCPIEYRAARGAVVRLVGSREVQGWRPVTDPAVLQRLDPEARGRVFVADLAAQGITDWQGINSAQVYSSDPGLELFFDGRPMTLARYPNEGYLTIAEALGSSGEVRRDALFQDDVAITSDGRLRYDDPRPARWTAEKEGWLHGFWVRDWRDLRVRLGGVDPEQRVLWFEPVPGQSYEVRKGQWFYAQNLLCELDRPGEWYLDREQGALYFMPPSPLSRGRAAVSVVRDPIRLDQVSHVSFRRLIVEEGRGTAFLVRGGAGVRIVGCTLRNMGNWGIKVFGGKAHGVVGCDVYQNGQGGIHLEGGDRKTLTPAGHYADNNYIHHTSRWDPVYQQAIVLYGVGNRATHNLIAHVPHVAIGFSHNDMVIEYNEIHSSVFQSNDAGAIYTSPPDETWSMRGHRIRYNYLHHIHGFRGQGCNGVYLDDCFSSAEISGNVFYDVATAVLIGGGRDNRLVNNLFLDCGRAFSLDARGLGWARGVADFAIPELLELGHTQPPWSERYPELAGILQDEPCAPKGNVIARNVCWGGPWGWIEDKARPYVRVEDNLAGEDPGFTVRPPEGLRLGRNSPARKIGFQPIPFRSIGLYRSAERASWPVRDDPTDCA